MCSTALLKTRAFILVAFVALLPAVANAADWPVFGHDPARTGYGQSDTSFSIHTVGTLRRRWVVHLDQVADSTPILLTGVSMPHSATRDLLFQTTKDGTTYAIDARRGTTVWRFTTHGPKITTSTPVADPSGRFIYVPAVDGQVHKLAVATGAEMHGLGFPLRITRMADVEKNASALNLANGYLYVTTSGYIGDQGPYDGHVIVLRLRDGATHVFNSLCANIHHLLLDTSYDAHSSYSCAARESGLWARGGVVVDPDPAMAGRVYVATGNGPFDANKGGSNYGDSVLALSADGSSLRDYFTPANYQELENNDTDLGSTAPVLLPREPRSRTPLMAIQGGKDGIIRLLNRMHLGKVHGELQDLHPSNTDIFTAPAVWASPQGTWIYVADNSALRALRLTTNSHGVSRLSVAWSADGGTSPVIINGVLFIAHNGSLDALDAWTGHALWTSSRDSAGGTIGGIHWESPIVVNGWVYISDEDNHLTAYALPRRS